MVKHINEKSFLKEVLESKGICIVDFYANWCGPCMMLSPILEEVANSRAGYNVLKIDVDENQKLAVDMEIDTIPTICIYKNGKLMERQIGYKDKKQIMELIEKYEN